MRPYGVPPPAARGLQTATIQATMPYTAELTWNGGVGVEGEYQRAINRMARAALGTSQSTPLGIIAAESSLTPARALLDHRQARFTQRLFSRPRGGQGPEEILTRESSALTARLRESAALRPGETAETQKWGSNRLFPGRVIVDKGAEALKTARGWGPQGTVDGRVQARQR